jgi:predicted deacylase
VVPFLLLSLRCALKVLLQLLSKHDQSGTVIIVTLINFSFIIHISITFLIAKIIITTATPNTRMHTLESVISQPPAKGDGLNENRHTERKRKSINKQAAKIILKEPPTK